MKIKISFLSLLLIFFSPSIFAQEEGSFGASSPSSLPIPVKVDATDGKVKYIDVNWKHISNVTYRVYRSSTTSTLKETHFLKTTDTKGLSLFSSHKLIRWSLDNPPRNLCLTFSHIDLFLVSIVITSTLFQ